MVDVATVETELLYADLEQAERRLARVERTARGGDRAARAEEAWLREVVAALQAGQPARSVRPPADVPDAPRHLSALTAKPVVFVANVNEGETEVPPELAAHAAAMAAGVVAVSARLEAELAELDGDEAAALRAELDAEEPALDRVVRGAFDLLDLLAFFTADAGKPAMSRHLRRGATAYDAAGAVHTNMQRGFARAEVIAWDELVAAGGYAAARERGTLRIEGRDYVVRDGDVVHLRFTT